MKTDGTPVLIRTSERSTWRRCRQKWWWKYVDRLNGRRKKRALEFGSLMHMTLEQRYAPGRKRGRTNVVKFFTTELGKQELDQWDDDGTRIPADELGTAMLNGYLEKYGEDMDIEIIAPERTFAIDVYVGKKYLFTYVGKFDALGYKRSTGRFLILEHKTGKSIEEVAVLSGYGEQGISYTWAANEILHHDKTLKPNQTISGVLFNNLRKGMPDERPKDAEGYALNKPSKDALVAAASAEGLKTTGTAAALTERLVASGVEVGVLGERSKVQPSPLFTRQEFIVGPGIIESFNQRIRMEGREIIKARNGKLNIYKNPTRDCKWDCEFKDMCELHEMGADWKTFRDMEMVAWDPYDDHELEAERIGA